MTIDVSKRSIGIRFDESGAAEVTVWAPLAESVELIIGDGRSQNSDSLVLHKQDLGYWTTSTRTLKPGDAYKLRVGDKQPLPDPVSLAQPFGVHGHSVALDLNYEWTDHQWNNIPLASYIIYELHTGTFAPEHNFEGVIRKLDYLVELGITAIEIMPVGQFPGSRNWGYDGVYPFAVQESYGGAAKLQALVDACHARGIAVILDVIYNHLGPEGNYLGEFGPYFTDKYKTPWGQALNFDDAWCDGVRHYFIENALMWFRDFHIDALRMDAVHAIKDFSPDHILKKIRQHVDELSAKTGKPYYLIAEMDLNDPMFINPIDKGGYGADAQWIDEFHHALRVSSGQAREGYYSDFNGVVHLTKSYNDAYVYDGQFSDHRKKIFGVKTHNPGQQFVVFSQNHDHTGNRMMGERTSQLVSAEMCKLLAGAVMVSPYIPMLFMGEEYAETNPFQFFISHTDEELAALVNKGRREEFSSFNWQGEPPDPRKEDTFNNSSLQWQLLDQQPHAAMLRYYKKLIELRKTEPAIRSTDRSRTIATADETSRTIVLEKRAGNQTMICLMNFSDSPKNLEVNLDSYHLLLDSSSPEFGGKSHEDRSDLHKSTVSPESIKIYATTTL